MTAAKGVGNRAHPRNLYVFLKECNLISFYWLPPITTGLPLTAEHRKLPTSGGFHVLWPSPSLPSTKTTMLDGFSARWPSPFTADHENHPRWMVFMLGGHPLHCRALKPLRRFSCSVAIPFTAEHENHPHQVVFMLGDHLLHNRALKPPTSGDFHTRWPSPSLLTTKTSTFRLQWVS